MMPGHPRLKEGEGEAAALCRSVRSKGPGHVPSTAIQEEAASSSAASSSLVVSNAPAV